MVTRPDGGVVHSKDQGVTWVDSGRTVKLHGPTFRAPQTFVLKDGTVVVVATWHVHKVGKGVPHLCGWISKGIALDTSCYGYSGAFLMKDESIMLSYCESSKAPNRVYVMRIKVNEARDGIELLSINK